MPARRPQARLATILEDGIRNELLHLWIWLPTLPSRIWHIEHEPSASRELFPPEIGDLVLAKLILKNFLEVGCLNVFRRVPVPKINYECPAVGPRPKLTLRRLDASRFEVQ